MTYTLTATGDSRLRGNDDTAYKQGMENDGDSRLRGNDGTGVGMTWVGAGMMESPICCGPGAIHAAKVNGIQFQEMLY